MIIDLKTVNFGLLCDTEIHFNQGMTAITGETGAGKSMLLDALELTLGSRADPTFVRDPNLRTELIAQFDITHHPQAQAWLENEELDNQGQCILRRTLRSDGRSRAYINGYSVPTHKSKQFAEKLLNLYGQHAHQNLLKREAHRDLVDNYGNHKKILDEIKSIYRDWRETHESLKNLVSTNEQEAQRNLLLYQVNELEELALEENDYENLFQEHKQLANQSSLLEVCEKSLNHIHQNDHFNLIHILNECLKLLIEKQTLFPQLNSIIEMLENANIQLEEASSELSEFLHTLDQDPARSHRVEERLESILNIARKHHIKPQDLYDYQKELRHKLDTLSNSAEHIEALESKIAELEKHYHQKAAALRQSREKAARTLAQEVTKQIMQLGMPQGQFEIHFSRHDVNELNPYGSETIEFMISTNPGRPLQPLHKVASGGELSRIALAIQVITARSGNAPTLIFDEVDVGISGGTAEIVGKLLRQLGRQTQVICITHQAQVASNAHHHLQVIKHQDKAHTESHAKMLNHAERIEELARMLGGITITKKTLQHAKELLTHASAG